MIINRHHIKTPTEIIDLQLGIPQDYKQECINEIYKIGNSIDQPSNVYATRSTFHIWEETKVLDLLFDQITNVVFTLYKDKYKQRNFRLESAWSAIYKKGNGANPHEHLPNAIAFVYYLQSNGDTPLVFNEADFKIEPKDDTLIIFPSYLIHSVPPHEGDKDRICVAGNFYINKS